MTNRPRFPERAAVMRALRESTNGHGVPPAAVPRQVKTAQEAIGLADHLGVIAQPGASVTIPVPGGMAIIVTPDFAAVAATIRAKWDEMQAGAPWTGDMLDHLALVEDAAAFQQATGEVFRRWHARHGTPAPVQAEPEADPLESFPDAPTADRPPMRLLDDEPPCST